MSDRQEDVDERVVNVTFHGIGQPKRRISAEEEQVWVGLRQFHAILDSIAGCTHVRITFDDGNASDVQLALPALLDRRMRAAFFVLAGRLGQVGSLSRRDLKTLLQARMIIGLHGKDHLPWGKIDDGRLTAELVDARKEIEDALGEAITWAACPFGSYTRRVLQRLREQSFDRVYSSDRGPARERDWLQPRNTIRACDDGQAVRRLCECKSVSLRRWLKKAVKRLW
ncbi:MAG: polysaccharide deacetylase family protein [Planctomycetota bacterium]|nr:polysaccharide deacetylase family protein [Planctomycetota bacterium]